MTTWTLLNIIGWAFLIASWVVPYIMKKDSANKYFIGAVLAAVACGIFVSNAIVDLMK